jgi:hypothetical protein
MKTEKFVELPVYTYHEGRGWWGVPNLINMSDVTHINPDKNWCRVHTRTNDFLITAPYEDVKEAMETA